MQTPKVLALRWFDMLSQAELNSLLTMHQGSGQESCHRTPQDPSFPKGESEQCWGEDRRDGDKRRGQITGDWTELKEDTSK